MKRNIKLKIALIIVGLILITFFVKFCIYATTEYRKKTEPVQEGFDFWNTEAIPGVSDDLGLLIPLMLLPIFPGAGVPFALFDILILAINTVLFISKGLTYVGAQLESFVDTLGVIGDHVACGEKQVGAGFNMGFDVFSIIMTCIGEKIVGFIDGSCTIYYFIDMILGTIYLLFVIFPVTLIYIFSGIDLLPSIKSGWATITNPINEAVLGMTKNTFGVTSWPDSVVNKCYKCRGSIGGSPEVYKYAGQWSSLFKCTNNMIGRGLKNIGAGLPGKHWSEWYGEVENQVVSSIPFLEQPFYKFSPYAMYGQMDYGGDI
jgi:hypothetical protein